MITAADIKRVKSAIVTDTSLNGGRPSRTEVVHGSRHGLFPRITSQERTAGLIRYRKMFLANVNADDEEAYLPLAGLLISSPAGDRLAMAAGTLTDAQSAVSADAGRCWHGVGQLVTALSGGETEVVLQFDGTDYGFLNGGYLRLSSQFLTGQTAASGVLPGDSVTLVSSTWQRAAATTNITHPKGIWCGNGVVHTAHSGSTSEVVAMADLLREDEVIGEGDGSTTPTLSALADATRGVAPWNGLRPVLTATCGGVTRTINVAANGACSGYCSAGVLNMTTGAWTTPVAWTTAPDTGTDITITYRERCYARSGNQYTIELGAQVLSAYTTASTWGAGCVSQDELVPSVDGYLVVSAAGTFDSSGDPVTAHCAGAVEDTFTMTFSNATAFTCAGLVSGSVGSGSIAADFSPTNPDTGTPYFTLPAAGWGGTWAAGNTLSFTTHPAAMPLWFRQVIPAGMSSGTGLILWGSQVE